MTWGDIAREALLKRGLLFHSDVVNELAGRLASIAYPAVAAACAERLLSRHLLSSAHRPFTVSCRHPLDCMWGVLAVRLEFPALRGEIEQWLQNYYDSPLHHTDGEDGPNDADHDPAAAFIYAAESLIQNSPESAGRAMERVVDDTFYRATEDREASKPSTGKVDDYIADCCHPIVQDELRWLQGVVAHVESHALSPATVAELRQMAIAG